MRNSCSGELTSIYKYRPPPFKLLSFTAHQLGEGEQVLLTVRNSCSGELTLIYKYRPPPPPPPFQPLSFTAHQLGEGEQVLLTVRNSCSGELTLIYKYPPPPTPFLTPVIHSSSVRGGGTGSVDREKLVFR